MEGADWGRGREERLMRASAIRALWRCFGVGSCTLQGLCEQKGKTGGDFRRMRYLVGVNLELALRFQRLAIGMERSTPAAKQRAELWMPFVVVVKSKVWSPIL